MKRIVILIGILLMTSFCVQSCRVKKGDNGKHKGWFKNPNNPHNPANTKSTGPNKKGPAARPGKSKGKK